MTNRSIDLSVDFSISEKEFIDQYGQENWLKFKNNFIEKTARFCVGCNYAPKEVEKLQIHILNKEINFDNIDACFLCPACHSIKHFDIAAKNEWIVLVNSKFSQEKLVSICREGNIKLKQLINEKQIFLLKKTPSEYMEEIMNKPWRKDDRIKIIFGSKFNWKNTR
jgi:hypothetical protein